MRKAPFLVALNFQCTMMEPSKGIVEAAQRIAARDGIVSMAYVAGFPPADLFHCGPSVVAYARDQALADAAADELAALVSQREAQFVQPVLDPDEAVRRAMAIAARASRPVVIADTQDNPGSGGSGDTTGMIEALVRNGARGAVVGILCDAEAAAAAHAAGEGAAIDIALGGRSGPEGVQPFRATFRVRRLGDGHMRTSGPVVGGRDIHLGPMALLEHDGVSVVVSSKRVQAYDQAPFRHLGVEPSGQKILVLKSSVHFRGDFQPIAEEVLVAVAPGAAIVDTARYAYRRLRPGVRLYPLGPAFRPDTS